MRYKGGGPGERPRSRNWGVDLFGQHEISGSGRHSNAADSLAAHLQMIRRNAMWLLRHASDWIWRSVGEAAVWRPDCSASAGL